MVVGEITRTHCHEGGADASNAGDAKNCVQHDAYSTKRVARALDEPKAFCATRRNACGRFAQSLGSSGSGSRSLSTSSDTSGTSATSGSSAWQNTPAAREGCAMARGESRAVASRSALADGRTRKRKEAPRSIAET